MAPLSHSQIQKLRRCPLAYSRYRARVPEAATAPRDTGVAFHDVAEEAESQTAPGEDLSEAVVLQALARKAALLEEDAAEDLRDLVRAAFARGFFPGFPSDAQDRGFELRLAIDGDGQPVTYGDPAALLRGRLDRFYRENGGSLAVVDDWKTGRIVEAPGEQMRAYALLVFARYPDVEEVVARLRYVRGCFVKQASYTREALAGLVEELHAVAADLEARSAADRWEPRVGKHCASCGYRASCPAFAGEVVPLRVIASVESARDAALQLAVLKGQAADLEEQLRAYVREHGNLDLGEEWLGYREKTKRAVVDARVAAGILRRELSDDRVWEALRLPVTELDKLLREATKPLPAKKRRDRQEALFLELAEANAVETSGGSEFTRWAKTDEGEEAA